MSVTERPVPVPSASPARLLVRVKAASLNPVDYKLGSMPLIGRFKRGGGVGLDFSGVIEGLPEGYTGDLKSGDEVFGHSTGTLAEFCLCAPDEIARKPANMSFVEAASIPTTGLTSLQSLRIGGIEAGKEILVIGASGGCGTMGVQIAKALGARVTGICGTANVDFVRSLGADVVLDYNDKAAIEGLKTGGAKFDGKARVLNHVGENNRQNLNLEFYRSHFRLPPFPLSNLRYRDFPRRHGLLLPLAFFEAHRSLGCHQRPTFRLAPQAASLGRRTQGLQPDQHETKRAGARGAGKVGGRGEIKSDRRGDLQA